METRPIIRSIAKEFMHYQSLGDRVVGRLTLQQLLHQPAPGSNSIALLVKHLHGNMLSRWTDFLTSDGEKPWRHRDQEFTSPGETIEEILHQWQSGWDSVFQAIDTLEDSDLDTVVYIRNEGHSVREALLRQLAHYAYHVGQIVYLGKMYSGDHWKSLTIPPGDSVVFNQHKFEKEKSRRHYTDQTDVPEQ